MPDLSEKAAGGMGDTALKVRVMRNTVEQQIDTVVELLELIDRKRQESGNPSLGSVIERSILNAHLWATEKDILENPGALGSMPFGVKRRYTH
jgi:hypothetical protein